MNRYEVDDIILDEIAVCDNDMIALGELTDRLTVVKTESDLIDIKREIFEFGNKYDVDFNVGYEERHNMEHNVKVGNEGIGSAIAGVWKWLARLFSKLFGGGGGGSDKSVKTTKKIEKMLDKTTQQLKFMEDNESKVPTYTFSDDVAKQINRKFKGYGFVGTKDMKSGEVVAVTGYVLKRPKPNIIGILEDYLDGKKVSDIANLNHSGNTMVTEDSIKNNIVDSSTAKPSFTPTTQEIFIKSPSGIVFVSAKGSDKELHTHVTTGKFTDRLIGIKGSPTYTFTLADIKLMLKGLQSDRLFHADLVSDIVVNGRNIVKDASSDKKRKRLNSVLKTMKEMDNKANDSRIQLAEDTIWLLDRC